MSELNTYKQDPLSGGDPKQIVFLLHGLGSNGQDLISLAPYFGQAVPDAVFLSPDAPFPCDMAPGMMNSYQWFSLQSRDQKDMEEGAENAFPILNNYIDSMLQYYDLKDENAVLCGFSQGCMMSLYTAPRRNKPIAGVLGYSGALVGEEGLKSSDIQKMPIHLIHGEADDVVPVVAHRHASAHLTRAGYDVSGHTTPHLTHSIDEQGIASGAAFLKSVL
ncbi:MAG: dienelactone hydrolase family protein [Pseudomonadota bacterium]